MKQFRVTFNNSTNEVIECHSILVKDGVVQFLGAGKPGSLVAVFPLGNITGVREIVGVSEIKKAA